MNITEVRVKLMRNRTDRLRAFCSITIDDDFVVHDLRVIEGRKGLFVAMPSRKLSENCPHCGGKNELRARFCNECGKPLPEHEEEEDDSDKYHVDVAHPINTPCREMLQATVLAAYEEEARRADEGLEPVREYSGEGLETLTEEHAEAEREAEELEAGEERALSEADREAEAVEEPEEPERGVDEVEEDTFDFVEPGPEILHFGEDLSSELEEASSEVYYGGASAFDEVGPGEGEAEVVDFDEGFEEVEDIEPAEAEMEPEAAGAAQPAREPEAEPERPARDEDTDAEPATRRSERRREIEESGFGEGIL